MSRIYFPKKIFTIDQKPDACIFTASVHLRIGRSAKTLARKRIEDGLAAVKKHTKEKGENLKRLLETTKQQSSIAFPGIENGTFSPMVLTLVLKERKMNEYPVNVFFYGSYMNFAVLKEVDINERAFDVGSIGGYALTISQLANVIKQTRGVVYGILTALTHVELERLYQEHARGKLGGQYLPEAVVVNLLNGIHTPALCYVSHNMKEGKADPAYVDRILKPARQYGFPASYLDTIESFR